jgi:hypothetical protein
MSRIIDYLVDTHGEETLERWPTPGGLENEDSEEPDARRDSGYRVHSSEVGAVFLHARGINYLDRWSGASQRSFYSAQTVEYDVQGYDWFINLNVNRDYSHQPDEHAHFVVKLSGGTNLEVYEDDKLRVSVPLADSLERLMSQNSGGGEVAPELLTAEGANETYRARVVFTNLRAEPDGKTWTVQYGGGGLLLDKK